MYVFNWSNFTCDTDGKVSCEIVTREGVLLGVHMQNKYLINDRLVSVIESFTYMLLFVHFRRSSSFFARNFSYQMFSVLKLLLTLCYTGLVQELYYLIMCIVSSWQWPLVQHDITWLLEKCVDMSGGEVETSILIKLDLSSVHYYSVSVTLTEIQELLSLSRSSVWLPLANSLFP